PVLVVDGTCSSHGSGYEAEKLISPSPTFSSDFRTNTFISRRVIIDISMDWSQMMEPQMLVGLGAFAFGALNFYMRQRHNRQELVDEGREDRPAD
uniref:HIG1 domain-containing protein n=1 Tax=Mesocestoides corti TaxID=53468 RepID=A0A5K3FTY1_MESCO